MKLNPDIIIKMMEIDVDEKSLKYFIKAFEINSSDKIIANNLFLNYINLRNEISCKLF